MELTVLECPRCPVSIIGSYADLRRHVRREHTLVDDSERTLDARMLDAQIKAAQKQYLDARIERERVVSRDDTRSDR